MKQTMKRIWILAGAASVTLSSMSFAQYRIDTGRANDANNRAGSGGLNSGGDGRIGRSQYSGVTGNDIVTGNVTAGKEFRGRIDYASPRSFRGEINRPSDIF